MNEKTSSSRSTLESTSVKRSDAIISFHARAQHCHSAERASTDQSAAPEAAAAAAAASESLCAMRASLSFCSLATEALSASSRAACELGW